jgi:hypothetical protein
MEWTASKPTPSSSAHLLWDWADAAAPGSSGEAAGRRGKEKRAKVTVGEEGSGGGGGGGNARCQVEGCGVELRAAKEYHRKHRVCEAHTKSPRVVVAGQERRFCQQCSRWVFLTFRVCSPESCSCTLFGCSPELRFSRPPDCSLTALSSKVLKLAPFCDCFCATLRVPLIPGISEAQSFNKLVPIL